MEFKKIAIFDYDCTITQRHLFKTLAFYPNSHVTSKEQFIIDPKIIENWDDESTALYYKILKTKDVTQIKKQDFSKAKDFLLFIFGGEQRLNDLNHFYQQLIQNGVELIIASHGICSHIMATLDEISRLLNLPYLHSNNFIITLGNDESYMKHIMIKSGIEEETKLSKGELILQLIQNRDLAVFIDDTPDYYQEISVNPKIKTVDLKQEDYGMNNNHMEQILQILSIKCSE